MHSSRMYTVRRSSRLLGRGVSALVGVCPGGCVCPGGVCPGCVCPGEVSAWGGRVVCQALPVNRMTDACENITLRTVISGILIQILKCSEIEFQKGHTDFREFHCFIFSTLNKILQELGQFFVASTILQ